MRNQCADATSVPRRVAALGRPCLQIYAHVVSAVEASMVGVCTCVVKPQPGGHARGHAFVGPDNHATPALHPQPFLAVDPFS